MFNVRGASDTTAPLAGFDVTTCGGVGIGFELAKCCARKGFDLLLVADEAADVGHDIGAGLSRGLVGLIGAL